MVKETKISINSANSEENEKPEIEDKYSEAWDELGAPIFLPSVKYLLAVIAYAVDNFFLIKNTYNALKYRDEDEVGSHPKIIAGVILGLHLISSVLISVIDSLSKDAISGRRGKYLNNNHKGVIFLRILAHLTLTMKLFRYTTAYLENRRRNKQIHLLRMRREKLSEREIWFVVHQKKNQFLESYYDLVESFFKTVPAALLQVFFMFQINPQARLRLYSTTDQDRAATVFFTVITASISVANYQCDYLSYKKVLHFQDCFRSEFKHLINLVVPGDVFLISNIIIQIATIGIRICFYSLLMFISPLQFLLSLGVILFLNLFLGFLWNWTAWRFRPILENPLVGIPWLPFNVVDLWINIFVPGVHYSKPLDHLLNFYTTIITGLVIFRGFDFLNLSSNDSDQAFLLASAENVTDSSLPQAFQVFNVSSSDSKAGESDESVYFIGKVIRILLLVHEYVTFSEISYAMLFYKVVKYMNIVNVICFLYTCVMNLVKMFDLNFPIQLVNDYYLTILNNLNNTTKLEDNEQNAKFLATTKCKKLGQVFLIFSLLPNSQFFTNLSKWDSLKAESLDKLVEKLLTSCRKTSKFSSFWTTPLKILYPSRFREPEYKWNIAWDKGSILCSLEEHPLREQLTSFVDELYHSLRSREKKLCLAVFCSQYNDIVRHYTSLRLKKTFELLDIPVAKGKAYKRQGRKIKNDYEIGYIQRLVREARGKNVFI